MAYYKQYFTQENKHILTKNPFNIYLLCKLFDNCRPDKTQTQRNALKNLTNHFLYWCRLSQINDVQPHHGCFCFHCKIFTDCTQILLERNKLEDPVQKKQVYL